MKFRLRYPLSRRMKRAATAQRRGLQCERLEARCLLHGMPLAMGVEVPTSVAEGDDLSVAAHVATSTTSEPPAAPTSGEMAAGGDDAAVVAVEVGRVDAPASDDRSPAEPVSEPLELGDEAADGVDSGAGASTTDDSASDDLTADDSTADDSTADAPTPDDEAAADQGAEAPDSDDQDSDDSDSDGDLKPEGEAVQLSLPLPLLSAASASGSGGMLAAVSDSSGVSGAFVSTQAATTAGDKAASVAVGRVGASADLPSSLGALSDSPRALSSVALTDALSLSGEDSLQQGSSGTHADRSATTTQSISLSLNADMQAPTLQAQTLQPHSLQTQSLQTQSVDGLSATSVPWLASDLKFTSGIVASASSAFSDERRLDDGVRSLAAEGATHISAQTFTGSRESAVDEAEADQADENGISLDGLRARVQLVSQQREADRAVASSSMHEKVARHAKRYLQRAYLHVREGTEGVVELAIGQGSAFDQHLPDHSGDQGAEAGERDWVFASMGLYRTFDLAPGSAQPTAQPADSPAHRPNSTGQPSDPVEALKAIDAAHGDEAAEGTAADRVGQFALPLSLLTLTGLLAISRQRFGRKQRAASEA